MRTPRLKHSPPDPGFYHCISRCTGGDFLLGAEEKERLRKLIRRVSEFCGATVITYAILSNHFHLLVQVPAPTPLTDQELARRVRLLNGRAAAATLLKLLREARASGDPELAARLHERYARRMHDVSVLMQEVKQRFTRWYNQRHNRRGTLWSERFRSVLVEPPELNPEAATAVAAYIDLNPVRAGIVSDPARYRWCGYAEALSGSRAARNGIQRLAENAAVSWSDFSRRYRDILLGPFHSRSARDPLAAAAKSAPRGSVSATRMDRLRRGDRLDLGELVLCRVRYFIDGAAIGSRAFVDSVFAQHRKQFGPSRESGARPIRGLSTPALFSLRDLRIDRFG